MEETGNSQPPIAMGLVSIGIVVALCVAAVALEVPLVVILVTMPLAGAIVTAVMGPRLLKESSHFPVIAAIVLAFLCSIGVVQEVLQGEEIERVYSIWTWAGVGDAYQLPGQDAGATAPVPFNIDVALRVDGLTALMLAMVTFVSSLVAIFAVGYMHGERGYWRFFAYISLFVFSMTMLVSVSNFVLLYVFWEAVGVCSYLLIGFWYQKPEAAAAGKKAFLVNRVGDFGFALALFLIWTNYGTLNFHDAEVATPVFETAAEADEAAAHSAIAGVLSTSRIEAEHGYVGGAVGLAICLLLMLGACGKSAQFPLHVWLPDAMEGPTPVSALIHAATMVTAGVYMVTRCTPLFMVSPEAQLVVAVIGALTALLAGLIALTQYDLKRVLAYSTISQLGYMFLGLGTGTLLGITAGMFHLFTHAFFKALLFLGAGSVMHAMGNVIDMRRFGGLRRLLPITHWTFAVGCLALAGVFPLSGFWSKDAIVASVEEKAHELSHELESRHEPDHASLAQPQLHQVSLAGPHAAGDPPVNPLAAWSETQLQRGSGVYQLLYYVALFTAFLTAFYTFRAFLLTFYGEEQVPHEAEGHAHESPPVMWVPLALLAFCAVFAGMYFELTHQFADFVVRTPSLAAGVVTATTAPGGFHLTVAATSTLIALAGIGIAMYLYLGDRREIDWLTSLMKLQWVDDLVQSDWASRLSEIGWVSAMHRTAGRVGFGWLTALLGYAVLLLILFLSVPVLIFRYLAPYDLSHRKFFFDEIYEAVFVWPLRGLAAVSYWCDRWIVDGLVNLCGRLPPGLGSCFRRLQSGMVPFYALAMVLGALVLVVAMIFGTG